MPRRIDHVATFDATPERVHAALADPGYWSARVAAVGGPGASLDEVTATAGGIRVALTQSIAAANLPSIVATVKPGDLRISRTESWGPLAAGAATATTSARVEGTPATITGSSSLAAAHGRTTLHTTGEATVRVPLVGGAVEQAVADNVVRLLEAEAEFTSRWLAGRHSSR